MHLARQNLRLTTLSAVILAGIASGAGGNSLPERVSFNDHIRPIFAEHCVACHGGFKQASGLSFIYRSEALAEGESGEIAIVPGEPDASFLIERVTETDPDFRMPPEEHGPPLTELYERALEQADGDLAGDARRRFALQVVANALLNLDEVLTR